MHNVYPPIELSYPQVRVWSAVCSSAASISDLVESHCIRKSSDALGLVANKSELRLSSSDCLSFSFLRAAQIPISVQRIQYHFFPG